LTELKSISETINTGDQYKGGGNEFFDTNYLVHGSSQIEQCVQRKRIIEISLLGKTVVGEMNSKSELKLAREQFLVL
jgi:hypothetical protein